MKLFYCRIPAGNFGDDLNPYLWPRLLPDAFDGTVEFRPKDTEPITLPASGTELFVGIGTLIRGDMPVAAVKQVFGSGFGYGALPDRDTNWHYHCVRGPLTAAKLGLDPAKAITDPAVLVRLLAREVVDKRHAFSFIPHWEMALSGEWERVCRLLGINYIDPRQPPADVIETIAQTRTLITEALHGAIVADALRVPWIPVSSQHTILNFKWEDWCRSVGVVYAPAPVPTFWTPRPHIGWLINGGKRLQAAAKLSGLMRGGAPVLSADGVIENRIERLLSTLDGFCRSRGYTLNATPSR